MKTTKVRVKLFETARDVVFTLMFPAAGGTVWVARNTIEYQVGRTLRIGDLFRVEHSDGRVTFRFEDAITGKPAVAIGWWLKP